jgi:hypothetical protein
MCCLWSAHRLACSSAGSTAMSGRLRKAACTSSSGMIWRISWAEFPRGFQGGGCGSERLWVFSLG